ncbi:MAG: DUF3784 domain-containing protein [Bifidobacteriaceae bacterium]|jgi:hypothetical protein|nr:DUF3784 domain-containing protein [Bifidobacteriaceae bacterium]
MVLIIFSGCAGLLLVLGVVLVAGKGAMLIAGYNQMSKTERAQINTQALTRSTGLMLLVEAVITEAVGLAAQFNVIWAALILTAAIPAVAITWIIRLRHSPHLRVNPLPNS